MVSHAARGGSVDLIPEHVLAHVPGAAGGAAWAKKLAGGSVNSSYRVETPAGKFVVRVHHPTAAALGADHAREARLHAAAADAGLAPGLIHVDPSYRFMVMRHVDGPTWTPEDFGTAERIEKLGETLRALHAVPPPEVAPFDLASVLDKHHRRLSEAVPDEAATFAGLMVRAAEALRRMETGRRPRTIVHHDLHHLNLIGTSRVVLLDWEYASVTDPLLDLASVHAYYPQSGPHLQRLLEAGGLAQSASREMLDAATWLFVLVSYFWYRARRLVGTVSVEEMATERGLFARLA